MKKFSILLAVLFSSSLFALGTVTYTYDTDLNNEQQSKLNSLKSELYNSLSSSNTQLSNARTELRNTMNQKDVDETKVSSLIDTISNLEKAKLQAKYNFMRNARTFLSDKQIKANDIGSIPSNLENSKKEPAASNYL